jgi:hypothetical protein
VAVELPAKKGSEGSKRKMLSRLALELDAGAAVVPAFALTEEFEFAGAAWVTIIDPLPEAFKAPADPRLER